MMGELRSPLFNGELPIVRGSSPLITISRKESALEISSVEIAGTTVFLGDCENQVVVVKIFEVPAELPDTVVNSC